MIILHCAEKSTWDVESKLGSYGLDVMGKFGYIPCMNISNLTAENFSFSSMKDYIILCINTDVVNSEIKYEKIDSCDYEVPNIYGPLNLDAVCETLPYSFNSEDKFVITDEIQEFELVNRALNELNLKYTSHKKFHDGTYSKIILLNDKYIIKKNEPKLLESEVLFSKFNQLPKLQKVVYADDEFDFIIYEFIPGDVMHTVDDFDDVISNIKEITSSFKNYDGTEFGYVYNPSVSWGEFLRSIVHDRSLTFSESFNYLPKVYDAITILENYPFEKKLIHGDFGTHNFIKENGKFVGAIDPIPLVGDPLYDVIYSLASNVDLLNKVSIDYISETFAEPKEKVKALFTVVLFCRFAICLKYHKEDIDDYIDFWYKHID